jgi:hypothetical protein
MVKLVLSRRARATSIITLAAGLAACGSDSATAPRGPTVPPDVSALVTASANSTFGGLARSLVAVPGVASVPINTAACPYTASANAFVCAPVTTNGITYKASYQLLDAGGHPLSVADGATLAAVRTIIDVDGTASFVSTTTANVTATTIHSHSDNTLSGLLTTKHVLNGTTADRDTLSTVGNGLATKIAVTATTTVANLDIPTAAGAYPATGTITSDASTTVGLGTSTFATTTRAVVTFNGTSVVSITLGIGSTTERCTFDLAHAGTFSCTAA